MPETSSMTKCYACRHPLADGINAKLAKGQSPEAVSRWLDTLGDDFALTGKSLRIHRREHLQTPEALAVNEAVRELKRAGIPAKSGDLAALVRDVVYERAEDGTLNPSLAEGLRAQEMLDRRADKGADRDLMLSLAGLISGAIDPRALASPMPLPALGDGLDDEREADEATFRALLTGGADADNPYRRPADIP